MKSGLLRQRTQIFSQLLGGDNKNPLGFIKTPKKQNKQIEDILVFLLLSWVAVRAILVLTKELQ